MSHNRLLYVLAVVVLVTGTFGSDALRSRNGPVATEASRLGLLPAGSPFADETASDSPGQHEGASPEELFAKGVQLSANPLEAAKWFEMAIKKKPDYPEAYAAMAQAYAYFAIQPTPASYFKRAVEYAKKALELRPNYPEAYLFLGRAYLGLNRNEDAAACFTTLARLRPESPEVMWGLANSYKGLGRVSEETRALKREIELKADIHEPEEEGEGSIWGRPRQEGDCLDYLMLADLYQKAGRYELARTSYERVAAIAPTDSSVRERVGQQFLKMGYKAAAINEYNAIVSVCAQDKYAERDGCLSSARRLEAEIVKH